MVKRTLEARLRHILASFRCVFLTGPRQSGKTTLARSTCPDFAYVSLEDLNERELARSDPKAFLSRFRGARGAILDEVQHVPELFNYLQGVLDEGGAGPFILTGSQHFLMSEKISQSLAGRVAILELLPFSFAELSGREARPPHDIHPGSEPPPESPGFNRDELLWAGMFPRIHDQKLDPATWLGGYVRTYVERDVRRGW